MAELTTGNQELRSEVERLSREKKHQAALFSKGTRTKQPKRPGRKPGQGTFSFRQWPRPEAINWPKGPQLRRQGLPLGQTTEVPGPPAAELSQVLDRKQGRARELAENTRTLLQAAVDLWKDYRSGQREEFNQPANQIFMFELNR